MRTATCILSGLALLLIAAAPAVAQSAKRIGKFGDWGTYSYQSANGQVCYILTVPTPGSPQPPSLDHGDMFFFVSQRPGQSVTYEPQFIAGYPLQEGSKVSVTIGDRSFSMFTKGKSAWVENAAEEPQMIAAMKAGADMRVRAKSGRGNDTSYTFSLRGISAALTSIATCQ